MRSSAEAWRVMWRTSVREAASLACGGGEGKGGGGPSCVRVVNYSLLSLKPGSTG